MKRLMMLAMLSVTVTMLFASAATAQGFTPPGPADGVCEGSGEGDPDCAAALLEAVENEEGGFTDTNPQVGDTCPPGFAAFGDPGTGQLTCIPPDDPAITQYSDEPIATPSEAYTALPDTGGSPLLLPVSILLVSVGVLGFAVRRSRI